MKTAISLPDETYRQASQRAKDLGLSRSEFFARAAERYLHELDRQSEIEQINAAVSRIGADEESAADAVGAGHGLLQRSDDEW